MPDGALPIRHLSVRVPWHDAGWVGTVCNDPVANSACLRLANIHRKRDDGVEVALAGRSIQELTSAEQPPCVSERATFMAPFAVSRQVQHPYHETAKAYGHYLPTTLTLPAYSAGCVPFRWLLRENAEARAEELDLVHHDQAEVTAREVMGFDSAWVQNVDNQRRMLDGFFSAVQPEASLAFFYAKEVPFCDAPGRVLVGVGWVTAVGQSLEYDYSEPGPSRSLIWERPVSHSIRPEMADGFLLPYHDGVERAAADPGFDPAELVVMAPDEAFEQFSYGSEHVSHDQGIGSLLNLIDGLERAERSLGSSQQAALRWAGARLGELWRMRGPFPGLGSALHAFGIDHAHLLAHRVAQQLGDNEDPWPLVGQLIDDPGSLGAGWESRIGPTTAKKYRELADERRSLLHLVARFDVSADQAERFYLAEVRSKAGITMADADLLANPYLLYEADRGAVEPIPVRTIDRGVYPDPAVADAHPVPEPSAMTEAVDPRRVRAHIVAALERRAAGGDTLATQDDLVTDVRDAGLDPPCPVDADLLSVIETQLEPVVRPAPLADGRAGLQLDRLALVGEGVRGQIAKRAQATKRHQVDADWPGELDRLLDPAPKGDEDEAQARAEKVAALEELAAARVCVLIGPAGTGKTTLLAALCAHPAIRDAGVLLLAPTGKARVQLEKGFAKVTAAPTARTIAEFLIRTGRYNPETGAYQRSDKPPAAENGTVIID